MPQTMQPKHPGYTWNEVQCTAASAGEDVIPTFCAMCSPSANCRLYAFRKNGKMTRLMGMAEGSKNQGAICSKGLASAQWLYSPDRLTTPLLRVGEKGEGKFKPISWQEAIDRIAEKLLACLFPF